MRDSATPETHARGAARGPRERDALSLLVRVAEVERDGENAARDRESRTGLMRGCEAVWRCEV